MKNSKLRIYFTISCFAVVTILLAISIYSVYTSSSENINDEVFANKPSIRILHNLSESEAANRLLSEVCDEYRTENGISVICESLYGSDFYIRLNTDFSSGHAPDIVVTAPGYSISHLYQCNKLALLQDELKNDADWYNSIDKSALNFTSANGNIYGIPLETEYIALYVNTNILKRYGLNVPENFTDLKNTVRALSQNSITPIAFGQSDEDMLLYQAIAASLAGYTELDTAISSSVYSTAYTQAFELMKTLYSMGAFPSDSHALSRADTQRLFLDGSAAMIAESSTFAAAIEKDVFSGKLSEHDFEIIAFPSSETSAVSTNDNTQAMKPNLTPVPYGAGNFTVFAAKTSYDSNRQTIMNFMKRLASRETAQKLYDQTGSLSAMKINKNPIKENSLVLNRDLFIGRSLDITPMPDYIFDEYIQSTFINSQLNDILNGNSDPQVILNTSAAMMKTLLN